MSHESYSLVRDRALTQSSPSKRPSGGDTMTMRAWIAEGHVGSGRRPPKETSLTPTRHLVAPLLIACALGACRGNSRDGGTPTADLAPASIEGGRVMSALRAGVGTHLPPGLAAGFHARSNTLSPRFAGAGETVSARVLFPARSTAPVHIEDAATGASVDVTLADVTEAKAEPVGGYLIYEHAHRSGAHLLHRALPAGAEDFLSFESKPVEPRVAFKLSLGDGVSGLRLVAGTLELLDAQGAPRLRVAPPELIDAAGVRTEAPLAVEGCAVDTSPVAPWGRSVTEPGARTCVLRVRWDDARVSYPAILDPRWTTTGSLVTARQGHTATLLANGKVLVAGGSAGTTTLASAELFDPNTRTWAMTGSLTGARQLHTATTLNTSSNASTSGKVLVSGGLNGTASVNTAQLYAAATGTWTAATNLNAARHGHTATMLANGQVLIAGGLSGTTVLNTAATYNPASGTGAWTAVGNMASARQAHTATLLVVPGNTALNNKVLVVGGNSGGTTSLTSVQLFDPASGWSTLGALSAAREGHTATALPSGNVLITGGKTGASILNTAMLFSAGTGSGSWSGAGAMSAVRRAHTATLLPASLVTQGQVLIAGGSGGPSALATAEIWTGGTSWTTTAALASAVQGQTATALASGMILLAGGSNGTSALAAAQLYDPSSGLACTSNGQCATGFCVAGVCCDSACNGGCGSCTLAGKVGTCSPLPTGTTCHPSTGTCDPAETCSGTLSCPPDSFAANGSSCSDNNVCTTNDKCQGGQCVSGSATPCSPQDQCHLAGTCNSTSGVCSNPPANDGTTCNDGNVGTEHDSCRAGICVGVADPAVVTSFDAPGRWTIGAGGTVVGLNANHTQGSQSLEVTAHGYVTLTSVNMTTPGAVGPVVLLDILLPTQQANPSWFGAVQLYVSAPSAGIYNAFLGQDELTGLPRATWQTLGFQLTSDLLSRLAGGPSDVTFTIAVNVPADETGHYLLDNLRFSPVIQPVIAGVAKDPNGVNHAVFTYTLGGTASVDVPYGRANFLADANGFLAAPPELPIRHFVPQPPAFFSATMTGSRLSWTVGARSATADQSAAVLPVETLADGSHVADLPDGTKVPIDGPSAGSLATTIVPTETSYTQVDQAVDQTIIAAGETAIGPTAAGAGTGTFDVTNDGAAEYVYPIDVPAGRAGVQPRLSLVYNSRSGNGLLGPGWTLKGVSRIARCQVPYFEAAQQGFDPAPINYSADTYCLDGERLIGVGTDEFRTKRDALTRVVVTGRDSLGPLSFKAYRKDGLIETYGLDSQSRYESVQTTPDANGAATQAGTRPVRIQWGLAQVVDRFGNQMDVTYLPNSYELPLRIKYTSNALTGRAATKTVNLNYGLAPATRQFVAGVQKLETAHLTSITISALNPTTPSLVASYKLTYAPRSITGRQVLTRIQRCDGAGVCMAPTRFEWETGSWTFQHVNSTIDDFFCTTCSYNNDALQAQLNSRFIRSADVNGDGFPDLIYRSQVAPNDASSLANTTIRIRFGSENGFGAAVETQLPAPPELFDINGDGRADAAVGKSTPGVGVTWTLYQATAAGGFQRLPLGLTDEQMADPNLNPEALAPQTLGPFMPGDFNGDGLIDLARQLYLNGPGGEEQRQQLGVRINSNGVLGPYQFVPGGASLGAIHFGPSIDDPFVVLVPQIVADLQGAGRTAIALPRKDGTIVGIQALKSGLSTIPTNVPHDEHDQLRSVPIDFNGDGLVDFVHAKPPQQPGERPGELWVNTGNGFLKLNDTTSTGTVSGPIADMNGDRRDDAFHKSCSPGTSPLVVVSTALESFTAQVLSSIPGAAPFIRKGFGASFVICFSTLVDVNGDGQMDVVQVDPGSDTLQIYVRTGRRPDRLRSIVNGLGSTVDIGYVPFHNSDACTYPYACGVRSIEVVSRYHVSNGQTVPSQPSGTNYNMVYQGARTDARGAGWLGFEVVKRTNENTLVTDTKTFDLTTNIAGFYPYVSLPQSESIEYPLSATGRRLQRSRVITYKAVQTNAVDSAGPYFVAPETITEHELEAAGNQGYDVDHPQRSSFQRFTYDSFGNVLTHETDGQITNTVDLVTNVVTNDTSRWLLGQVSSTTIKSTSASGEAAQRVTTFRVDPNTGAVNGKTSLPGDPAQLDLAYTRNPEGLVTLVTATAASGEVRTSGTTYDAIEGTWPAVYTNAFGQVSRVSYHPGLGVLASATDVNEVTTTRQYDGLGRARTRSAGTGRSASFHYLRPSTSKGNLVTWSDSTGRGGLVSTDDLGRETLHGATSFGGNDLLGTATYYDAGTGKPGLVSRPFTFSASAASVTPPEGTSWQLLYDESGRVVSSRPPGETVHTISYLGLTTTESVGPTKKSYRVDDGGGRTSLTSVFNPIPSDPNHEIQTSFDYGPFGALRHVYQPGGSTVTLQYDPLGRRVEMIDPDSGDQIAHYDAFGGLVREERPGQPDIIYGRDSLGRLVSTTQGDAVTSYAWDTAAHGIGKLASDISASGVSKTYAYQANGLLQSTTWTDASAQLAFDWTYDASGRLETITYPDMGAGGRYAVQIEYGNDGRPVLVNPKGGGSAFYQRLSVEADGQTGLESFGVDFYSKHSADPLTGRVTNIQTGLGPALTPPLVQDLGYIYYSDGKLLYRNDNLVGTAESFAYDNADRVTDWTRIAGPSVKYGYDDDGNLISRTETSAAGTNTESYGYAANEAGPHALTSGPLGTYHYDPSGRQTTRPGQPTVEYDHLDLPTRMALSNGSTVTLSYDAEGARFRKTTAAGQTLSAGLYERRVENGVTTHVLYLPGDRRVIGQMVCSALGVCDVPTYFHGDRLGTVDTATSRRAVVGREHRDPFGRPYAVAGSTEPAASVALGFTGQGQDTEVGLLNLNRRIYDPQIGRFLSPDPLVSSPFDGQALNRYTYARNNPLSFTDTTGLQAADPGDDEPDDGDLTPGDLPPNPPGATVLNFGDEAGFGLPSSTATNSPIDLPEVTTTPDGFTIIATNESVTICAPGACPLAVTQRSDPEVPGQGSGFAASQVSPPSTPDMGQVWANAAVTAFVAPVVALLNYSGPNAQHIDINQLRPFPYSPAQLREGTVMELGFTALASAGFGLAAAADAAIADGVIASSGEVASIANGPVLSGHGAYLGGEFIVPEGTTITVFTEHGGVISNELGNAIETGADLSLELYPQMSGARTYLSGSRMPDYTLFPMTDLPVMGNPTMVNAPTQLSSLVGPGMGNVRFAACLYCAP